MSRDDYRFESMNKSKKELILNFLAKKNIKIPEVDVNPWSVIFKNVNSAALLHELSGQGVYPLAYDLIEKIPTLSFFVPKSGLYYLMASLNDATRRNQAENVVILTGILAGFVECCENRRVSSLIQTLFERTQDIRGTWRAHTLELLLEASAINASIQKHIIFKIFDLLHKTKNADESAVDLLKEFSFKLRVDLKIYINCIHDVDQLKLIIEENSALGVLIHSQPAVSSEQDIKENIQRRIGDIEALVAACPSPVGWQ
ncbi:MAG: hypothetical protein NTZ67_06990 [Gammaproteobacteria bacterium]|nr:hypothetical protein [Gammaproteobacteria bacterium]